MKFRAATFSGLLLIAFGCADAPASFTHWVADSSGTEPAPPTTPIAQVPAPTASGTSIPVEVPMPIDVEAALKSLAHVESVDENFDSDAGRKSIPPGYRRFSIAFRQPVDHADASQGTFVQRLSLLHRDTSRPMVLATSGYHLGGGRSELTSIFQTNQIQVEHRFFGPSTPRDEAGKPRYAFATGRASADDFHEIVASFRKLYASPWVSTGASKGGETVVYHRRFYPNDVVGTLAYVAPFLDGLQDQRPLAYAHYVGSKYGDCNERLAKFQHAVLARRDELKPLFRGTYERLGGYDVAIEHGVQEFVFFFFQYGAPDNEDAGCSAIPAPDAPTETLFQFLQEYFQAMDSNIDDESVTAYEAYYVQCAKELGFYRMETAQLGGMVRHPTELTIGQYLPRDLPATFDATLGRETRQWLTDASDGVVLIYGENDPWSGGMVTGGKVNAFIAANENHNAHIRSLGEPDVARIMQIAEGWLGKPPAAMRTSGAVRTLSVDELVRRRERR